MKEEVINYLLAYKKMKIIQRKDMFNFSLDTVLLAHFCTIQKDIQTIYDFGTNNAAIPLILSRRTDKNIVGIEIQEEAVEIAKKNVLLNHLEHQITIIHEDIKDYVDHAKKVKLIVCNPPFFKIGERSHINDNKYLQIARHETKINLDEIIQSASKILDNKGRLAMVHRPDRFIEVINCMQKYDIEPKRIRFVYPKQGRESHIFLIEGMYKGNPGLKIEPPLYAHEEDGSYTQEIRYMFGENENE